METTKQSWVTSNSKHIKTFAEIKQLYEVAERDMLKDQDTLRNFAHYGNELRRKLLKLKLKVKNQVTKVNHLLGEVQDQITTMKRLEVDVDIKVRSCKGSCKDVPWHIINLDTYDTWNRHLDAMKHYQLAEDKNMCYINLSLAQTNVTSFSEHFPLMQGKGLSLFEHIDQFAVKLEDEDKETDSDYL
ncbi:fibrinogen alpha chain-like [Hyperolius riggenbachi]|uniref:fibrinogen alpha chain-like n=1 Tax=Hyperolius riggenbachi TaxID=752182 RepID=UPI0035A31260